MKARKGITAADFLDWVIEHPEDWQYFYDNELSDLIYMLEQDDYFGTEGFNKRFS